MGVPHRHNSQSRRLPLARHSILAEGFQASLAEWRFRPRLSRQLRGHNKRCGYRSDPPWCDNWCVVLLAPRHRESHFLLWAIQYLRSRLRSYWSWWFWWPHPFTSHELCCRLLFNILPLGHHLLSLDLACNCFWALYPREKRRSDCAQDNWQCDELCDLSCCVDNVLDDADLHRANQRLTSAANDWKHEPVR